MGKALALALFLAGSAAQPSEVQISLLERRTSILTDYSVDLPKLELRKISEARGSELAQLSKYSSSDRQLIADGKVLAAADEVLYQCQVDGMDLVVVRDEYNSFFGPIRLLAALSGHPIQVSRIVILTIVGNTQVSKREIVRKDASYRWVVKVYK
jgi:hypothetical protein